MTSDPERRRSPGSRHALPPRVPTLGDTLRRIREERGYIRDYAAALLKISRSYLTDIERGRRTPSPELLELIIAGYRLDPALARHIRELGAAPVELLPTPVLAKFVTDNPQLIAHLRDLNKRGDLAAYLDPLWNVLACNDLFREAAPGLERTGSIPIWMFSADTKPLLPERATELAHSMASIRAMTGYYRTSDQTRTLYRHLCPNTEFRTVWCNDVRAAYGRDPSAPMHAIHPVTGRTVSYSLTITNQSESVLLLILSPKPTADAATNPHADG
ncbi:helix-turn-helix domain-containing protein [Nocardia takedensis]